MTNELEGPSSSRRDPEDLDRGLEMPPPEAVNQTVDSVVETEVKADATEDTAALGRMNRAISNPGAVKINVEGAFIVDDEPASRNGTGNGIGEGVDFEHKDIRLPHHTGVVSHVAVDVSGATFPSTESRH